MAQNIRQQKLFTAEDYISVYESYINANLTAFDYDTIRTAMVEYIRDTYPENYNDWVESSEFVALLDVVAQLGHNLAFRIDLNARNNFLSTAERQDSVFKLANFIGYTPKRNVPAFGELKVIAVKTSEPVIGSNGTSLGGKEIRYESITNANNLDDFTTVINSVLQFGNQFGSPKKQTTISNVQTQFYDLNNTPGQIKFDVNGIANGSNETFNMVSVDYVDNQIIEKTPDRNSSFGIVYKNSGKGISSNDTGFFVFAKQGNLEFKDFKIDTPIDNQTLDINVDNINNSDVWVQTIDTTGGVVKNWTNTGVLNTAYNNIAAGNRDIYTVKTRENNQISVSFADRMFGNLPTGIIRVWYRTSRNETYIVRPDDLGTKRININYVGDDGNNYVATLTVQQKENITSANASESLASIKQNAPLAYASQDRLVTANDYNTIMQYSNSSALKVKTVNRTFSGHSRYVDFTDPTGMYANLQLIGTDGVIYQSPSTKSATTSPGYTKEYIFNRYLKTALADFDLINLYYTRFSNAIENLKTIYSYDPETDPSTAFLWNTPSSTAYNAKTGFFKQANAIEIERVGSGTTNYMRQVKVGAMIKFITPDSDVVWAKVTNIFANGLGVDFEGQQQGQASGLRSNGLGAITLDANVPANSKVETIIPSFQRVFSDRESEIIQTYIQAKETFALTYDYIEQNWELVSNPEPVNNTVPNEFSGNDWLIYCEFKNNRYTIYRRTLRYVISSEEVAFTNIATDFELDNQTKKKVRDTISITGVENGEIKNIGKLYVVGNDMDLNGVIDPTYVYLSLVDDNSDARPDTPSVFKDIVGTNSITINDEVVNGKSGVRFEWKHIAVESEIVDPSYTNIHDVYVLDNQYDNEYRQWLVYGGDKPVVPTSFELATKFQTATSKKMISDTVVYKPVKYKPLFGNAADENLRAKFKIVKVQGSNVVDNEVKSQVLNAINEYFALENWDFGETFYFTELAAYVHKSLSNTISSFMIVPQNQQSLFGRLLEITPNTNEIFIPDVSIDDIDIDTTVL